MAVRFGSGNVPPSVPERNAEASGAHRTQPFVNGDRMRTLAASGALQTSQMHERVN